MPPAMCGMSTPRSKDPCFQLSLIHLGISYSCSCIDPGLGRGLAFRPQRQTHGTRSCALTPLSCVSSSASPSSNTCAGRVVQHFADVWGLGLWKSGLGGNDITLLVRRRSIIVAGQWGPFRSLIADPFVPGSYLYLSVRCAITMPLSSTRSKFQSLNPCPDREECLCYGLRTRGVEQYIGAVGDLSSSLITSSVLTASRACKFVFN